MRCQHRRVQPGWVHLLHSAPQAEPQPTAWLPREAWGAVGTRKGRPRAWLANLGPRPPPAHMGACLCFVH